MQADLGDSRFVALVSDPRFGVDPTDPRAKGSEGLAAALAERRALAGAPWVNLAAPSGAPKKKGERLASTALRA